jgi:hypothetical protein
MGTDMNVAELTSIFERLGAPDPAAWARSQVDEGIPQLARFLFLRQAWGLVVDEQDTGWVDRQRTVPESGPGGAVGPALARLLDSGASRSDLTTLVRTMQWEVLFGLCYLLDDPGQLEPEVADMAWGLFQLNKDGEPASAINGLHESVLETDPTGREMRPPA